jgi:quercetin dioxygenase-like cupin family protein
MVAVRQSGGGIAMQRCGRIYKVGLAFLSTTFIGVAGAQDIAFTPGQFKWIRNPATGSEIAPVMGDARQPGTFIVRVRYPAGMKAMPHSHPTDTLVTVISGTLRYGEGPTFDESKLKDYPAGSFFLIRANVPHYETATAPMEFQAYGTGPLAFNFVNPKDDPKSK